MLGLTGQGLAESTLFERAALAQTVSRVSLKVRKEPNHLDVMLSGIGDSARVVQERSSKTSWRGEIIHSQDGLPTKDVSQQVAVPEMGLASVRLRGSGSRFQLEVTSVAGSVLPKPQILATGDDLVLRFRGFKGAISTRQIGSLDLRRPGRIPQPVYAPPLRASAVAPPLGDMAVGSMLIGNRSFVQVSGPPVTLMLNNAPARDALMALARIGDYGFVYVGSSEDSSQNVSAGSGITMAFRGESYAKALNSVLMASGLQGKLDGRTLLVGNAVSSKTFGPQMSKVFRLNQVDVTSALNYLGSLGTKVNVANAKTVTATSREESSGSGTGGLDARTSQASESTIVESYGAEAGPLVGLVGTADARLNTLVLVGDPKLISVAEAYLKQIDLRKRQVAVKVQILNVRLQDDATVDSSFSAKIGNTFIVSESGKAHMNFGKYKPGSSAGTGIFTGENSQIPGVYPGAPNEEVLQPLSPVVPLAESTEVIRLEDDNGNLTGYEVVKKPLLVDGQEVFVPSSNPNETKDLVPVYDKYGRPKIVPKKELNRYNSDSFYSYIESVVTSSNAKTLAQPTLLVQEGEKASVRSGVSVITGVEKFEGANGSTSFSNTREDAGLTVDLEVEKIDDNGFITLKLDPTIAVPVSAGVQEGVAISDINERTLKSGRIRLRDRQTLILTGVIQEDDRRLARKWPLLGDLPLIGQLFRSSTNARLKNELVIIVTPSILDDENGGAYGYGYRPGTEAAKRLIGADSSR